MCVINKLDCFYRNYEGEKGYIGRTEAGDFIPYFAIRKTEKPVIIMQYAIHAREYITTYLALNQIKEFENSAKIGSVYFIPAVNIDGIKKCLSGYPLYKANIRGVDLNVNFDAGWGNGKENLTFPSSANYIGEKPFSESESRALRDFTIKVKPDLTVSYHSKGEEIYWEYNQTGWLRQINLFLAEKVSDYTGYQIKSTPQSHGGYKDWCIEKLCIPSLTIEVGNDLLSHPIGEKYLEEITRKNLLVPQILAEEMSSINGYGY